MVVCRPTKYLMGKKDGYVAGMENCYVTSFFCLIYGIVCYTNEPDVVGLYFAGCHQSRNSHIL